jgi:predicted NAD-dependent protein-ADP-ribosyltransferase YbiA (DUF1768 family)
MDVGSRNKYPAGALSNFSPHWFLFDGVQCASMEGFLQSLKFKNPDMQVEICKLVGFGAKKRGAKKNWHRKQVLYWKGKEYPRKSQEYQDLLDRAYDALAQNEKFKKALLATHNANLTHSIGKRKKSETVLTEQEFCSRLMKLRTKIQEEGHE